MAPDSIPSPIGKGTGKRNSNDYVFSVCIEAEVWGDEGAMAMNNLVCTLEYFLFLVALMSIALSTIR